MVGRDGPRDSKGIHSRWMSRKGLAVSAMGMSAQPALGGTGSVATEEWAPAQGWKRLGQALTFFLTRPAAAAELGVRVSSAGRAGMLGAHTGSWDRDRAGCFKEVKLRARLPPGRCLLPGAAPPRDVRFGNLFMCGLGFPCCPGSLAGVQGLRVFTRK